MWPTLHAYYKPPPHCHPPRTNKHALVCHFLQIRCNREGTKRHGLPRRNNIRVFHRSRPAKIYINIHFHDEYTRGNIYRLKKEIPKANQRQVEHGGRGRGGGSDATYRIRETRKRIWRRNVTSSTGYFTLPLPFFSHFCLANSRYNTAQQIWLARWRWYF